MEKLTRSDSASSAVHASRTPGDWITFGQGSYPALSLPLRTPGHFADGYGQPPAHHGQLPQAPAHKNEHGHVPPQCPDPVYDPAHNHMPTDVNIVTAAAYNGSDLDDVGTIALPGKNLTQRRGSLFDTPASPSASGENDDKFSKRLSSALELDPGQQKMPVAPPLPVKFGAGEESGKRPYSGIEKDFSHRPLKVCFSFWI
jgi:hypothetical protein